MWIIHQRSRPKIYIVCEIEAAIVRLPEDTKDTIRTSTASILHRASLPSHNNFTKDEKKALKHLEEEPLWVIMKADKGNCFVVLDRRDCDDKKESLPSDRSTNQLVQKSLFSKLERELNNRLLASRSKTRSMIQPTANGVQPMQLLSQSVVQLNMIKLATLFVQSFPASALPSTILLNFSQIFCRPFRTVTATPSSTLRSLPMN